MKEVFKHTKLIRPTNTQFYIRDQTQLKLRANKFRSRTLDKPIHLYRMYFAFVRLAAECEKNKIRFGPKNEHSVKLNKRFYKPWQIDEYIDAKFDDFFAAKIDLFSEEEAAIVKSAEASPEHLYLKFNRSQRKEDILRQARLLLKNHKFDSTAKYKIKKQYKYFYLHQQYNAFILRQSGAKNAEVREFLEKNYSAYSKRVSYEDAALRKLYRASERVVLDVAAGDF